MIYHLSVKHSVSYLFIELTHEQINMQIRSFSNHERPNEQVESGSAVVQLENRCLHSTCMHDASHNIMIDRGR